MLRWHVIPWPFKLVRAIALGLAAGVMSLIAITLVVLTVCGEFPNPEGADYDRELTLKADGLVYRIGEDTPYTGKAYCTVFNDRSSIWGLALHWQGEFKDGKEHGIWLLPADRVPDHGFNWGDDRGVVRVESGDGVEIPNED